MNINILPSGAKPIAETNAKFLSIYKYIPEKYRLLCFLARKYTMGRSDEYLSSIVTVDEIRTLGYGESAVIFADTGTGKSTVIKKVIEAYPDCHVVFLTNRKACKIQFLNELLKSKYGDDIPADYIMNLKLPWENLEVMTYQELVKKPGRFNRVPTLIILDEVHSLSEDSVFSDYGQKVIEYLRFHLDSSIRIYMTATDDYIIETISDIEQKTDATKIPKFLDENTNKNKLYELDNTDLSRIKLVYLMKNDWNYIKFKFYNPRDDEMLIEFIRNENEKGIKSLIYCNDKVRGKNLKEKIGNTQHIYSDEERMAEISKIAVQQFFESDNLVSTKVAENGLSLWDDSLGLIVAETWDFITLKQIIGRARVDRKKPRNITVLIPDYTETDIGTFQSKIYIQLQEAISVGENPGLALEHYADSLPFVYYSSVLAKPVVNQLAIDTLRKQYEFLKNLKEEIMSDRYAFVRKVLLLYDKFDDVSDSLFLGYEKEKAFGELVNRAFEKYKLSDQSKDSFELLKKELFKANEEIGAYPKEIRETMQYDTVNQILEFVGIKARINPKTEIYSVNIDCESI